MRSSSFHIPSLFLSLFIPLFQLSFVFPFLKSFVFNILSIWARFIVHVALSLVYSECISSWRMSFRRITESSGFFSGAYCTVWWVFYFADFSCDMFLSCCTLRALTLCHTHKHTHIQPNGHYLKRWTLKTGILPAYVVFLTLKCSLLLHIKP